MYLSEDGERVKAVCHQIINATEKLLMEDDKNLDLVLSGLTMALGTFIRSQFKSDAERMQVVLQVIAALTGVAMGGGE